MRETKSNDDDPATLGEGRHSWKFIYSDMASSLSLELVNRNCLMDLDRRFLVLERKLTSLSRRLELLLRRMKKKAVIHW